MPSMGMYSTLFHDYGKQVFWSLKQVKQVAIMEAFLPKTQALDTYVQSDVCYCHSLSPPLSYLSFSASHSPSWEH